MSQVVIDFNVLAPGTLVPMVYHQSSSPSLSSSLPPSIQLNMSLAGSFHRPSAVGSHVAPEGLLREAVCPGTGLGLGLGTSSGSCLPRYSSSVLGAASSLGHDSHTTRPEPFLRNPDPSPKICRQDSNPNPSSSMLSHALSLSPVSASLNRTHSLPNPSMLSQYSLPA